MISPSTSPSSVQTKPTEFLVGSEEDDNVEKVGGNEFVSAVIGHVLGDFGITDEEALEALRKREAEKSRWQEAQVQPWTVGHNSFTKPQGSCCSDVAKTALAAACVAAIVGIIFSSE